MGKILLNETSPVTPIKDAEHLKQLYPVQGQGKYPCDVALHEGEEPIPTIKARRKDNSQLKLFVNTQLEQS